MQRKMVTAMALREVNELNARKNVQKEGKKGKMENAPDTISKFLRIFNPA